MDGVLHVVSGPSVGACFVLGARTQIGRALDAHVQLSEPHVSRLHARIARLKDGGFELFDLGGPGGTMVNGVSIRRQRLAPNDIVTIGSSHFTFAYTTADVTARGRPRSGGRLRTPPPPTMPNPAVARGVEALDPQTDRIEGPSRAPESKLARPESWLASRRRVAESLREAILGGPAGVSPSTAAAPVEQDAPTVMNRPLPRGPLPLARPRHTAPAASPLGTDAKVRALDPVDRPRALLRDVLDYRALRLGQLHGARLGPRPQTRYDTLAARLLVTGEPTTKPRRSTRFACGLRATLTLRSGGLLQDFDVRIEDLCVGGARLSTFDPVVCPGDEAWLALDAEGVARTRRKVVLRGRVAWTSEAAGTTSLAFCGRARLVDSVQAAIAAG